MKRILKVVLIVISCFLIVGLNEVHALEGTKSDPNVQQRVYSTDLVVGSYGTITLAFVYNYNTVTVKKTFSEWTVYKVKPSNANTCWYISRNVTQNGNGLKMTVTAQGYNYNTRQTSQVYTFVRNI